MATVDPVEEAFGQAQRSFRNKLKDPNVYKQILATTTIDEVCKTTMKLQEEAAGKSRHLVKIRPFLDRLSMYSNVIGTFVQAKPEILALIWGPLQLLLQWSSQMTSALDKVVLILVEVGHALPHVELMSGTFGASDTVKALMALFYEDILDFYRVNFDFFRKPRWQQMLDALWDSHLLKLNVVVANLKQHSALLRDEVTLLDIQEAHENRIRSLAHFEETNIFQQSQKFFSLRDRISVNMYDDRLDWIRNRSVPGCEEWLLVDTYFCEWQGGVNNANNKPTVWLWLHGIPGSGKTYLCGAAIDHLRQTLKKQTLFVFLSCANNANQTALSVLQSFVFQAAEDDIDLQAVLNDATERELRGNTGYVLDLFKTWLLGAGPTFCVMDGLDEMDRDERQILLQRLDELTKACSELRLLICSQSEADISRVLERKAAGIQVNKRNSGSIQAYINTRSDNWISNRRFDSKLGLELRELLSPLSAKADGMFLFARIILDSVDEISIDEIRRELKAMPNDLNEAYQRIFDRINGMSSRRREKSRKVLGWIGCAPIPMTIFEMEQALLIDTDPERTAWISSGIATQDFISLCGPLIEIVDGKLQFVHFTVRDYIFGRQIPNHINEGGATRDLAAAFLAYLASDLLDPDLEDDQILGDIMCGGYRLLQYAHFYLPTLLQRLNSIRPDSYIVGGLLDHLTQRYRNHEFQATMDDRDPPYANSIYKKRYPTAYETVRQTFRFHLAEKRWGWNRNNSEAWVNFDPLITSKMLVRLQSHYEDLVADDDFSHGMQIHYGPCLFKCTYLFCTYSRRGFTTRQERDTHVANHERPFKCPVPNCIYYTLGFNVQRRCNEHLAQFHTQKFSADDLSNLKPEDAQPLLFTLTVEGDAENVQRLMSSPGGQKLSPEVVAAARLIAAEQGSLAITQLLAPLGETELSRRVVRAAVRSESIECAEWAIAKADSTDATELMKVALNVKSERIYRKWEEYILSRLEESPQVQPEPTSAEPYSSRRYKHHNSLIDNIFKQPVFSDIKGSVLKETRLQHTLEELRAYMKPHILGAILVRIAKSSCTLSLAKQILSYGAPVDYPRVNTRPVSPRKGTGITALHAAAKKNTKDAALLIQLLVMNGAIEDMARVREEPGAKGLPQFIGVSFNDLIQLRLQYQQTPREPSSPGVTDTELKIVAEKIDLTTS